MGLTGKLVGEIEIKSSGDVFYELFKSRPHYVSNICPDKIQSCDLHEGDWGTVGSVVVWNYTLEGKPSTAKDIIEAIDEKNKLVTFKVIEGDLLNEFKAIKIIVHVVTKGDSNLVTWIMEFEKLNEDVPHPTRLMDFLLHMTKDIEAHHLQD